MITNGDKVIDAVTGFEGTVTGVAEYLTGCRQCCVVGTSKDGKAAESAWFDDDRLTVTAAQAVTFPNRARNGGPQSNPAPTR